MPANIAPAHVAAATWAGAMLCSTERCLPTLHLPMLPRRMSGPLRPSLEMQRAAGGVERCRLARHLNHLGLLSFKFGTLTRLRAQTAGAIVLNLQRTIGICIYSEILCEVLEAQLWQLIAWLLV